jgi:5-phospho-D-xylono-1,4-lactonase
MPIIRTVLGDISPDQLGICLPHEHLFGQPPAQFAEDDLTYDDEAGAIQEMRLFYEAGGRSLVEMTTPDYGRNAEALRRISQSTGIHVISATGYNKDKFAAPLIQDASVEDLTERFIHDVTVGMDGTDIKAGVIKGGSMLNEISPLAEKVFHADARAHHATGAPISTHTEAGTMALEQVELLRSEGVKPEHIIIGHTDRLLDWEMHSRLARTGVYMGFDQISKEKYYPDQLRAEFIARLVAEGHGQQLLLAGDTARKSYWAHNGGAGYIFILQNFVPMLRAQGVTEAQIQDLLVHNPARALTFKAVKS